MWRMHDAIPIGQDRSIGGNIRHENSRTVATAAGGRVPEQRSADQWYENQVETKATHDFLRDRSRARPSLRRDVGEHRRAERLVRLLGAAALVDELPVRERVGESSGRNAPRADVVEHVRVAATDG